MTTALCCVCSTSRPVSIRYSGLHGEPAEVGEARCTVELKCAGPCGRVTTHAWLRVDAYRDVAEEEVNCA